MYKFVVHSSLGDRHTGNGDNVPLGVAPRMPLARLRVCGFDSRQMAVHRLC
jgi:hypothetical protein